MIIPNFDVNHLTNMTDFDVHELIHPFGLFSTIYTGFRSPVLQLTNIHDNEGIHFVKHASSLVCKLCF